MKTYTKKFFGGLAAAAFVCVFLPIFWHHRLDTHMKEIDDAIAAAEEKHNEKEADRLNAFIDASAPVEVNGVSVDVVTADMVATEKSIQPIIGPLLDKGYTMLINGAIEPSKDTTLERILTYYYPYEVKAEDKIIILKEK